MGAAELWVLNVVGTYYIVMTLILHQDFIWSTNPTWLQYRGYSRNAYSRSETP